jgi:transcriptional regulator with XRE-family HTH domain
MTTHKKPATLGEYLRQAREHAGYSQRELARLADVQHTYLFRIESGVLATPQPEYLQRIADVLELDVAEFFGFLGVQPKLPEPRVYFRKAYGVSAAEADEIVRMLDERYGKHGVDHTSE